MTRAERYAELARQCDALALEASKDGDLDGAADWSELADNWRLIEGRELADIA